MQVPAKATALYEHFIDIRLAPVDTPASALGDDDAHTGSEGERQQQGAAPSAGSTHAAGALHAPLPPEPIERTESATPRAQTEFFKQTQAEMLCGDLPAYKDWTQLEVISPPLPSGNQPLIKR